MLHARWASGEISPTYPSPVSRDRIADAAGPSTSGAVVVARGVSEAATHATAAYGETAFWFLRVRRPGSRRGAVDRRSSRIPSRDLRPAPSSPPRRPPGLPPPAPIDGPRRMWKLAASMEYVVGGERSRGSVTWSGPGPTAGRTAMRSK